MIIWTNTTHNLWKSDATATNLTKNNFNFCRSLEMEDGSQNCNSDLVDLKLEDLCKDCKAHFQQVEAVSVNWLQKSLKGSSPSHRNRCHHHTSSGNYWTECQWLPFPRISKLTLGTRLDILPYSTFILYFSCIKKKLRQTSHKCRDRYKS